MVYMVNGRGGGWVVRGLYRVYKRRASPLSIQSKVLIALTLTSLTRISDNIISSIISFTISNGFFLRSSLIHRLPMEQIYAFVVYILNIYYLLYIINIY